MIRQLIVVLSCLLMIIVNPLEAEEGLTSLTFIDGYFAESRNEPLDSNRAYFTQASRDDQIRLNLAAAGISYENSQFRMRLIGQYGDSVDINYNAEPEDSFKYVQESYVGYSFSPDTSVDIGTFLAHIGAEGWMSKDNINYTRSLIAEFSPYYETGVRFSHRHNSEWSGQVLLINGWQNTTDRRHPALGTQIRWEDGKSSVTSNTFFGAESGGARLFHDLIFNKTFETGVVAVASIDVGYQAPASQQSGYWWGSSLIGGVPISDHLTLNGRLESYHDPNEIIVTSSSGASFRANACSIGLDYLLTEWLTMRGEVKQLFSGERIFPDNRSYEKSDTMYVISLSMLDQRSW